MKVIPDQVELNQPVLDRAISTTAGETRLSTFQGEWLILYFYPKNDTPGCTLEGQEFSDLYPAFLKNNAIILGVSKDNLVSHEAFKTKYQFPFELISDSEGALCDYFDVMGTKNLYGKLIYGVQRSTFLINKKGIVCKIWRNVRAKKHAANVLTQLEVLEENKSCTES